ncbi:hypothetical protein Tco_0289740 [Tanacetum coccineum]
MPPTADLLLTDLDEFVNEPVVENCKAMSSEEESKVVRKNDDAPIIEEWVSDSEEENVSQTKTEKKIVNIIIAKKEFVKPKKGEKTARKTGNPQIDLQDLGVTDSGCSRHMTGNMSYLTDYEEIDGGYVAIGGNPKGARTPQQNEVAEKRNRTLIEAAKTMLVDSKLPTTILGSTQSNSFAGIKVSDNAGQARKEIEPIKDYILLPLWTTDPPYTQDPKSSYDDGSKPSSDDGKKVDEDLRKESECNDQEKEYNVNSTNNVNIAGTNEEMDIQEKDKNQSQNDKTEHENEKSVKKKSKSKPSQKVKVNKVKSKSTPG